jgi:hypothetical protein
MFTLPASDQSWNSAVKFFTSPFLPTYLMPWNGFKSVFSKGYADCLQKSGIKPLSDRRVDACEKLFNEITTTPAANMHNHIPSRYFPNYDLRHSRSFVVPQTKTNRFRNSFSPSSARHINNIN